MSTFLHAMSAKAGIPLRPAARFAEKLVSCLTRECYECGVEAHQLNVGRSGRQTFGGERRVHQGSQAPNARLFDSAIRSGNHEVCP
jgi:hypothetical protein